MSFGGAWIYLRARAGRGKVYHGPFGTKGLQVGCQLRARTGYGQAVRCRTESESLRQSSASTDSTAVDGVVISQFGLRLYERLLRRRESEKAG